MPLGQVETMFPDVQVRTTDWSHDGQWFAAGGADGVLRCMELSTGRSWSVPIEPGRIISAVHWRPGTEELACASGNSVWFADPRARSFRSVVSADSLQPGSLSWSPDGQHLAVAGKYLNLRIWDVVPNETRNSQDTQRGELRGVAWSPLGDTIATASEDGSVGIWNIDQHLARVLRRKAEQEYIAARCVGWSPDGRRIAGGLGDGAVVVWDVATGEAASPLECQPHAVCSVQFSNCGRLVFVSRGDLSVVAVECISGRSHVLQEGCGQWVGQCSATLSTSSPSLAIVASGRLGVSIWDVSELVG